MMKRNFKEWFDTFKITIVDYKYFTDFDVVYNNVKKVKIPLNILNTLVGSKNIESDFDAIIIDYPIISECIPLLLAVRKSEIHVMENNEIIKYSFQKLDKEMDDETKRVRIEEYKKFMRETGLFELLQNRIINNLYDYVTGVETGLDSNGRKARGGKLMANLLERYIREAGFEKNKNYFKELSTKKMSDKWGVDFSAISNNGKSEKRFDFVIKTPEMIYVMETNFYGTNGSKLNETARSYKDLAKGIKTIDGVTFLWITDGVGWQKAENNLEETFDTMDHLYNIKDLEDGILGKVIK